MNAEYMMVNPNELVIDLPVDDAHVQELMDSLQKTGRMLEPITVWLKNMRIANGFHRTTAAQRLGWKEVPCMVHDYTEDEFWDARIIAAKPHKAVEQQRLDAWIMESWRLTEWYIPDDARGEKWELYKKVWDALYSFDANDGLVRVNLGLGSSPLEKWLTDKASRWGINEYVLASTILNGLDSHALDAMRGKGLTFEQAMRASERLHHRWPGGHSNEGLQAWLHSEIKTDKTYPKGLWEFDIERRAEKARTKEEFWKTPQGKAQLDKRRTEKQLEMIRTGVANARAAFASIRSVAAAVPEAPAMLAEFAQFVADFAEEHFPDIEIAKPNPVSLENARLRAENSKLRERIASLERALGSKQAAGEMLSNALAWSSGDLDRN